MSDAYQNIEKQGRELEKLLGDIKQATTASLENAVLAEFSLGPGLKVTKWVLVEHFLLGYVAWNDLVERYLKYFGQSESTIPSELKTLRVECESVLQQIFNNSEFGSLTGHLIESWLGTHIATNESDAHSICAEELFDLIVESDQRERIAYFASKRAALDSNSDPENRISVMSGRSWRNLHADILGQERALLTTFENADSQIQEEVRFFVRNYRHATLRASWLETDSNKRDQSPLFAIDRQSSYPKIEQSAPKLKEAMRSYFPDDIDRVIGKTLGRVSKAIYDFGFDNFADDVTSEDFLGGNDSLLGSDKVGLLHSKQTSSHFPVLVAVSRISTQQEKDEIGLTFERLSYYLDNDDGNTRAVIVLSDHSDPEKLWYDLPIHIRPHYRKRVCFIFLLTESQDPLITGHFFFPL